MAPHLSAQKRGGTSNNNENGSLGHRGNTTIPRRNTGFSTVIFFPKIFAEKRVKITDVVPYTPLNLPPLIFCTICVRWGERLRKRCTLNLLYMLKMGKKIKSFIKRIGHCVSTEFRVRSFCIPTHVCVRTVKRSSVHRLDN